MVLSRSGLSIAGIAIALAAQTQAALIFYSNQASFLASTSAIMIEDFELFGPKNVPIHSFSHKGLTFIGHAGDYFPNIAVTSPGVGLFGLPTPTSSSVLTAFGNEDFTLRLGTPATAIGFETYLNQYGPATIGIFGIDGAILGSYALEHPQTQIGFFGVASNADAIGSIRWITAGGRFINTGIDNICVGEWIPPVPPVPEPGTMALFGIGLLGTAAFFRKKKIN